MPPPLGRICSSDELPSAERTPPLGKLLSVHHDAVRLILEAGIDP
jgi:hypothetical protein